jgi:hypothetical protein
MTHTVCGQPIGFRYVDLGDGLVVMVPKCETCGTNPPDDELSPGRPWELVDDDVAPETR